MSKTPVIGSRALFPNLSGAAYLAHSAVSPVSLPVADAVAAVMSDYQGCGLAAVKKYWEGRFSLRQQVSKLIGAQADNIAFVPNTTHGVVDIALCIPWRSGDRVVLFDGEFPTNVTPWQQSGASEVVVLDRPQPEDIGRAMAQLEEVLKQGVRLVAVSAVQFQTGLRMPLADIGTLCTRYNAEFFVDAIQACGAVPINVEDCAIDYLTSGAHKWLMALEGTAFLYIRPERLKALNPVVAGWLSHVDPLDFLFNGAGLLRYDKPIRKRADFVENGSPNTAGLAALDASLSLIHQLTVPKIYDHINAYNDSLERELVARGCVSMRAAEGELRSGILSVTLADNLNTAAFVSGLSERGVICTNPDGLLRFAPHWPNALDEVALVAQAFDDVFSKAVCRAI